MFFKEFLNKKFHMVYHHDPSTLPLVFLFYLTESEIIRVNFVTTLLVVRVSAGIVALDIFCRIWLNIGYIRPIWSITKGHQKVKNGCMTFIIKKFHILSISLVFHFQYFPWEIPGSIHDENITEIFLNYTRNFLFFIEYRNETSWKP